MSYEQLGLFDDVLTEYKIEKPVRLISFFSGIEAQFKALSFLGKELGVPVESYKTCEWAYNSICACNAIHNRDFTDYSEGKTREEMTARIRGISVDYNKPLTDAQLAKKPLSWIKKAYNACVANHNLVNIMEVHGKDLEINECDKYEYILTYSFPCQDLSLAGQRAGMSVSQADGGTRSGLLWEVERILGECEQKPNILIMENVPQIHSEKDYPHFEKWMLALEKLGYCNFWSDLNGKDYGIPQNRERTFMVSILGVDLNYKFPLPFERELTLADMLEEHVSEKYYLSPKMIDYLTGVNQKESKYDRGSVFERNFNPNKEVAATITTAAGQRPTDNFIIEDNNENKKQKLCRYMCEHGLVKEGDVVNHSFSEYRVENLSIANNEYNDCSPTLTTRVDTLGVVVRDNESFKELISKYRNVLISVSDDNFIAIRENTKDGYKEAHEGDGINISSRMHHQRGNVQKGMPQTLKTKCEVGVVITDTEAQLFTEDGNVRRYIGSDIIDEFGEGDMATTTYPNGYGHGPRTHKGISITLNTIDRPVVKKNLRIRKLTPKEAGRLMAFQDCDCDHMQEIGLGDGALYHVYGDSIIVCVLLGIFAKLFISDNAEIERIIKKYIDTIIAK